jgi:hypothetical protein
LRYGMGFGPGLTFGGHGLQVSDVHFAVPVKGAQQDYVEIPVSFDVRSVTNRMGAWNKGFFEPGFRRYFETACGFAYVALDVKDDFVDRVFIYPFTRNNPKIGEFPVDHEFHGENPVVVPLDEHPFEDFDFWIF